MTDQAIAKKRSLPVWSKLLMTSVVIALLATFSSAIGIAVFLKQAGSDAFDPQKMHAALNQVMQFPDELPAGYKQQMGLSTFGFIFCGINHAASNQQLALLSGGVDKTEKKATDIAKDAYDHFGVNTASVTARFYDVLNQGEEDVLGEKMAFITGNAKDGDGRAYEGMVGCIVPKSAKKIVLVYAVQPKGKPFDQSVVMNLLRNAKSF